MSESVDSEDGEEPWRARLRRVVGDHGGVTAVSRLALVPLQTLKNHLSGRTKKPPLEDLNRIADACDVPRAWLAGVEKEPPRNGFAEGDLAVYDAPLPGQAEKPALGRGRWRVTSRALDLAGFMPGDLVEFDLTDDRPAPGEVVVAQHYSSDGRQATTLLRIYEPPYLVRASSDPDAPRRPVEVKEGRVAIMGRFWRLVRERR
jgi:hypothetical protein